MEIAMDEQGEAYSAEEALRELQSAPPLQSVQKLLKLQYYRRLDAKKAFAQATDEIMKGGGVCEQLVKPVMFAVTDAALEIIPGAASLRQMGMTSQAIVADCFAFNYDGDFSSGVPSSGYAEYKNEMERQEAYAEARGPYHRGGSVEDGKFATVDQSELDKYRKSQLDPTNRTVADEYDPDGKRIDSSSADTDHIVPAKRVYGQLAGNRAIDSHDLRKIINDESNFAMTSAHKNRSKGDQTNAEYVKNNDELTQAEKDKMIEMGTAAQRAIEDHANAVVYNKLFGRFLSEEGAAEYAKREESGKKADKSLENKQAEKAEKEGKKPKGVADEQKTKTTADIYGELAANAAKQGLKHVLGAAILFTLRPLCYEIRDSVSAGLREGVSAVDNLAALKVRFSRVKGYLMKHLAKFFKGEIMTFVKSFIASFIEGLIDCFVGLVKHILRVIKEGVRAMVQVGQILWGRRGKAMTSAQKGDAILKVFGGVALAFIGVALNSFLQSVPALSTNPSLCRCISTLVTGLASALLFYFLDKMDFFNVKEERRNARIDELMAMQEEDMRNSIATMDAGVVELVRQREVAYLRNQMIIDKALADHDGFAMSAWAEEMAKNYSIPLPYADTREFIDFVNEYNKNHRVIRIGRPAA